MANEIAVGPRNARSDRDGYKVCFYATLDPTRIKTVDGQIGSANIVVTSSASLPAWARFGAAAEAALNAGTSVYGQDELPVHPTDTTSDLVSRVQSMYAAWAGGIQARYDSKYERIGTLVDAT